MTPISPSEHPPVSIPDHVFDPIPGISQTQRIQRAIDTCSAAGGGRIVFRPGVHVTGTLTLRDDVTLHIEEGAVIRGSDDIADYFVKPVVDGARVNNGVATSLVFAEKASRIAITGGGVIDGNGELFWERNPAPPDWALARKSVGMWIPGFGTRTKPRPRALVLLIDCDDVRIEDITLRESPAWTLHLLACSRVRISGMTLRGAVHGSNTDGVDLDACSDVLMEDCDIETGDDALCLKNTGTWGYARPARRIVARRCRLASTTHGFTIGTETRSDFEDILLEDSSIEMSGGVRTLTGIGLSMIDGSAIRNVTVRNVTVSDSIAPIQLRLGNAGRGQTVPIPGSIRGLTLENIRIVRPYGNSLIAGLPGHPLRDVALRGVTIDFSQPVAPELVMGAVPELDTEFPPVEVWRFLPAHGFYCRHVDGLEFSDVCISSTPLETRPAMILKSISNLRMRDVLLDPRHTVSDFVPAEDPATPPALLADREDFDRLRSAIRSPGLRARLAGLVMHLADLEVAGPAIACPAGGPLAEKTAQTVLRRVINCGLAFRLGGDRRHARRAIGDLQAVSALADWNSRHPLDTAELCLAFALGLDWLRDAISAGERDLLEGALIRLGLEPCADVADEELLSDAGHRSTAWIGGLVLGSLAVRHRRPDLADRMAKRALSQIPRDCSRYTSTETCIDTPAWALGCTYQAITAEALLRATGSTRGLDALPGFRESASDMARSIGQSGDSLADAGSATRWLPILFWFGRVHDNVVATKTAGDALQRILGNPPASLLYADTRFFALSLLWLEPRHLGSAESSEQHPLQPKSRP